MIVNEDIKGFDLVNILQVQRCTRAETRPVITAGQFKSPNERVVCRADGRQTQHSKSN